MAEHDCDKGMLFDVLVDGQKEIFGELKGMNKALTEVAVQQNELQHMRRDINNMKDATDKHEKQIDALEMSCERRHGPPVKTLLQTIKEDVIRAAALAACLLVISLFAYIGWKNSGDFFKFQRGRSDADILVKK